MKKLIWAALLGLPILAVHPQRAAADGCLNLQGGFKLKICASTCFKAWCDHSCASPGCGSCPGGGCGYGGGGCYDCSGQVPGPWYTYWPTPGTGMMTSPYSVAGWTYENHFQLPAPVFPYWPQSPTPFTAAPGYPDPSQLLNTGFQQAGYYPTYWYGR
jgi:hypothetical protein